MGEGILRREDITILLSPTVICGVDNINYFTDFRNGSTLTDKNISLSEFGYDLGTTVFLFHELNLS